MRGSLQAPSLQLLAFKALDGLVPFLQPLEACLGHFEVLLRDSVPPALANDVTKRLLQAIDESENAGKGFTEEVVRVVLIPTVTALDCSSFSSRLASLVNRGMFKLTKLKELKVGVLDVADEDAMEAGLKELGHLESFSLVRMCTDSILTSACEHCRRLRSVDVSGSARVTDLCVSSLLALRHLEHLDVFGTGITTDGLARLVQGLPSTLQTLGCTHAHLGLVKSAFPLLTSLKAGLDCIDVTLHGLRTLSLHGTPWYGNMPDFLGHQLLKLEFHGCQGVDVSVIAHNCCALEYFVMSSCSYSPQLHQTIRRNTFGFRRLKHLTLDKSSKFPAYPNIDKLVLECTLSSAHEIQVFRLESYAHFNQEFFESLLTKNDMRHLRELSLFATYSDVMDMSTLTLLLMRCRNLDFVSLRGLPVPGVETFQRRIKHDFPEVKLLLDVMDPCGF